ncbi:hypothetical protein IKD67_00205 [Candidatus Saccharibacteria bacterium]|nr:hypothetical protein [Candidatus Saccharibacteria bacterium]
MDPNKISKPDFQAAEQKIQEDHKKEVERRLSRMAWRSFETDSYRSNDYRNEPIPDNVLFDFDEIFDNLDELEDTDDLANQTSERLKTAENAMRDLIHENFVTSAREYGRLMKAESDNEIILKNAILNAKILTGNKTANRSKKAPLPDIIRGNLRKIEAQKEKLAYESPESYTVVKGMEFRNHIKEVQNNEMVTTAYVKSKYEELRENMEKGEPSFIHGHLGSGKTELAIMTAKHTAISNAAIKNAREELKKHIDNHPGLSGKECRDALGRFYRLNKTKLEKAFHDGDKKTIESYGPLIISGSKDIETQDLFADKTLKLTKFNGKELLEHKEDLDSEIKKWMDEHQGELDELNDKERNLRISEESHKIVELYKLKNQAFGTEVEIVENAIYKGIKQGRPVIIDEVNTIPAGILLSLNDVLQRHPGDQCYIPGVGPTEIKEGFSVTMTGNLPYGNVNYRDREELDPAWVDRLRSKIEYDYLPMSKSGKRLEQTNMEGNELFQAIIAYLADRQGNLELPEMEKSLDKIFALCQVAHVSQLVFKGDWDESKTSSGDTVETNLEASVLSMRGILRVLKEWNKGSDKNLDQALWDGHIGQTIIPEDRKTLLMIARNYGFFSDKDGWKINFDDESINSSISLNRIHPGAFYHEPKPLEVYSLREVVDAVYGKRPEREIYPDDIDFEEIEDLADDSIDMEDLIEAEERIKETSKTIKALEVLAEQCGCNNTDSSDEAE